MDLLEIEKIIDQAARRGDEVVNLSHRGLTVVSSNIQKLLNVRKLSLNDNKLLMPPAELTNLLKLDELVLDNNKLTMLPTGIGKLANLEYLSICVNPLGTLPSEIGQLLSLTQLWAVECQLVCLPTEIGQLIHLERLSVRGNNITDLPGEIEHLKKLVWLCLAENKLHSLPTGVRTLRRLSHLDLNNNQFTEIPHCLLDLSALASLHLKGNRIKFVSDDTVLALSGLTTLDLRSNDLCVKPSHWKGLEYILVGGSHISKQPEDIEQIFSPYIEVRGVVEGQSDESEGEMEAAKGEPYEALSGWKINTSEEEINNNEM